MSEGSDQEFWDRRYRTHDALWSGRPNGYLMTEADALKPGRALDVGCGEGTDALWLAERGWRVTAVDISEVALQRAAARANERSEEVAARIDWVHGDLTIWDPGLGRFELVSAHYLHLPSVTRRALFRRMAASVTPGGSLLIVGHHPSDMQTTVPRPPEPDVFFTGDEIADALDPLEWTVITNAATGRSVTDPAGNAVTIHDTVVRAQRHL